MERPGRRPPRLFRPQGPPKGSGEDVLDGHAQEAGDRPRPVASTGGRLHGRADDRSRREHAADAVGPDHRRQQGVRDHGPVDESLHRGGRRPVWADLDHRPREDRGVGIPHGPQGPRPIGLRRTRDERGRGRGPAPFDPRRLRGPEPGDSMDPPGHRGRGGPPEALLDVEDGRDPTDQRGEAEPRDRLPRHHG